MTHAYNITGMTCGNCVAKARNQFLMLGDVTEAQVQLSAPQATITMQKHIPLATLQDALRKAGNYTITEAGGGFHHTDAQDSRSWLETYKPVLLIGVFITGVTLILEALRGDFNWHAWMQNFMAGFFLVFSFFKLLNLKGFAESYSSYDIIARRWAGWGYVYAFVELGLGIAFLTGFYPLLTNAVTLVVMGVSIIGVLQSVFNKRKIQCACLGAVFNLPMSTITIIEDALMIVMSGVMLVSIANNNEGNAATINHSTHSNVKPVATLDTSHNPMEYTMSEMMHNMHAATATGNNDIDFAVMMIEHHKGAVEMAEIELNKGQSPELKAFARKVIDDQEKEILFMEQFVSKAPRTPSAGASEFQKALSNSMAAMMDGSTRVYNDIDKDFAAQMIPHHQSAVDMANAYLRHGEELSLRSLSENIVNSQTNEIVWLKEWLVRTR